MTYKVSSGTLNLCSLTHHQRELNYTVVEKKRGSLYLCISVRFSRHKRGFNVQLQLTAERLHLRRNAGLRLKQIGPSFCCQLADTSTSAAYQVA